MQAFFTELYKYRYLIQVLVVRDIKKKYRRSILGVLWSILNPLLMMAVTSMVFSTIFRFDIPNYLLYLLTGQILFNFYAESTNFAMSSILDTENLYTQIFVPSFPGHFQLCEPPVYLSSSPGGHLGHGPALASGHT